METTDQIRRRQEIENAKARLVYGAKIAKSLQLKTGESHVVEFRGGDVYELKIEYPGVLRVYDAETSVLWAESVVGVLDQPNPDFRPPRVA